MKQCNAKSRSTCEKQHCRAGYVTCQDASISAGIKAALAFDEPGGDSNVWPHVVRTQVLVARAYVLMSQRHNQEAGTSQSNQEDRCKKKDRGREVGREVSPLSDQPLSFTGIAYVGILQAHGNKPFASTSQ